jgi:hypothetical protein
VNYKLVNKILKGWGRRDLPQPLTSDVPDCYEETSVNNLVNVSTPQGAIVLPCTRKGMSAY